MGLLDILFGKSRTEKDTIKKMKADDIHQMEQQKPINLKETASVKKNIQAPAIISDIDGNVYHTVKIGNQVWTIENLRTTRYNDGNPIPLAAISTSPWSKDLVWKNLTTPGYCWYNNDENMGKRLGVGALYNWWAIATNHLAPLGWRIPSREDWYILGDFLVANGYNYDGTLENNKIAKALAANSDWQTDLKASQVAGAISNDVDKNNRSGFSALPGGFRDNDGNSYAIRFAGKWWSSTQWSSLDAFNTILGYDSDKLSFEKSLKMSGFSVRLLMD